MSASIDRVAVVGAGRMGHGIALVYALAGHDVVVVDVDETVLTSAPRRVDDALDTLVRAGDVDRECADAALSNLRTESDLASAVAGADVVTEAVAEDISVKRSVFADLDAHAPVDAVLATNTSGLSIADIDRAVKAGFGFRLPVMGIFEKVDQSGLDVHHAVERSLMPDLDRGTDPNPVITELLELGETGWESGTGVYDWTGVDRAAAEHDRDEALLALRSLYEGVDAESSPPPNYAPDTDSASNDAPDE